MVILLFKLLTTPTLIAIATLVSRRFGQATGGWLVGLPLTSGPVAIFVAIEQGPAFAQVAASGSLEGTVGQAFFATTYATLARRWNWRLCLVGAAVAFIASGWLLSTLRLPMPALLLAACASLLVGLRLVGKPRLSSASVAPPRWDVPARMAVASVLVLVITSLASAMGPNLTGLVAAFPIFALVLGVFAHTHQGPVAAQSVMRGLMLGLFGFTGFFAAVSLLATRVDLPLVFTAALVVNLAIHGAAYLVLHRIAATTPVT